MRLPRVLVAALLAALPAAGLAPSPAAAQPFPRLGLYGSIVGGGYPYVHPDFTIDTSSSIASTASGVLRCLA